MKFPKEKIIITLIVLVLLFLLTSIVVFSSNAEPSVSARAAVLYEPITKTFLFSKNADERMPFASTTKIMTALVAIENFPIDSEVEVVPEACGIEGSSLYLKPGEVLSMRELLVSLMLRSANDAAAAIAYAVAGGIEEFADMMNERALQLGLKDTHFTNPHGLDNELHYTTARELALIAAKAMENETFREICSLKKDRVINSDDEARLVVNHNKLLKLYDGAIGIKTGFTKKSGRCLVGAAERDGLTLITVTLDAPDDWSDHARLFDRGFSLMEARTLAQIGEFSYTLPILDSDTEAIGVSNAEGFSIITRKDDSDVTADVNLPRYVIAPVEKGQELGKVTFYKDGELLGEIPLIAEDKAQKTDKGGFFRHFKNR